MNILYITASDTHKTNTVKDYDYSFSKYSKHNIFYFDIKKNKFDMNLDNFDAVILSYAFMASLMKLSSFFIEKLKYFSGKKIVFFQDEYLTFVFHRDFIKKIEINAIITVMPEDTWNAIYGEEFKDIPKLQVLTGYIPEYMHGEYEKRKPLTDRKWQIGYRSRPNSPLVGKLPREKYELGLRMKDICCARGIPANIEVEENLRIYGHNWSEFIRNCQVMLGSESGCNVFDFDGSIKKAIANYERSHPNAGFWDIYNNCVAHAEDIIKTNQISPRIFEAASLGTGHILFEGEYSGLLQPWRNYIPLKKDYSNLDEVFGALEDHNFVEKMIDDTYMDLVASGLYDYKTFIARIDTFLEKLGISEHNKHIDSYFGLSQTFPRPLEESERDFLRNETITNIKLLAKKYSGKKILAYGGGESLKKHFSLLDNVDIKGIILDDYFLKKNPQSFRDIPYISFDDAKNMLGEVDIIILFCRVDYHFSMFNRVRMFLGDNPKVESCVLY